MRNHFTTLKAALLLIVCASQITVAQINVPITSPPSTVTQKVGIAEVKVEYARPSMRGRKIFGELLTFDKIWRAGANAPTKLTFSDSMVVAGKKLAPGSYSFYVIPNQTEWTIIFGKNSGTQAGDHKEADDALRFKVPVVKLAAPVETFTIDFANLTRFTADILLTWEQTSVKFKIENDADKKITSDIKSKIDGTDLYWQAANYYYDTDKDLNQALIWINKVVEKDPAFFRMHVKAKILAKLKDCKGAIEAAQKSKESAIAAKNDDYIKMNDKLIADCKGGK